MKIKTLKIQDYKSLSDVSIDNFDVYLNLFIGNNGAGKSSILDTIVLLLSDFRARLQTSGGKGLNIPEGNIQRGSRRGCRLEISLANQVKWSKFKTKSLEKEDKSSLDELNNFTKEIRIQLDTQDNVCVPIIAHYGVKRTIADIPLRFIDKDGKRPTEAYTGCFDSKASYRDIFPWLRSEEDYENELIRDNPNYRNRGLVALREALQTIMPDYSDMRVRRKPKQEVTMKKNGIEYPISQLSDGEKCYIALVCDIVRRLTIANPVGNILQGNGIVLIDEVDLHLHPSWEQSIMERLHSTFPNIQFIVSAHSPLVASHFDGNVYAVNNGVVTPLPRLYGLDYSTILQDWMSTAPVNKKLNSMVELYYAYKANNMQEQAERIWDKILAAFDGNIEVPFVRNIRR